MRLFNDEYLWGRFHHIHRTLSLFRYDGSLIVQIGSTSLSLKETFSSSAEPMAETDPSISANTTAPNRQISVLDIIIGKSRALTSLQTRGTHLTFSGVTNIGTIAMDVPLRPQEVHDLVNRAGRLITSYVHEFLPDEEPEPSNPPPDGADDGRLINTSLNLPTRVAARLELPGAVQKKPRANSRRTQTLTSDPAIRRLQAQQSTTSLAKRRTLEVHITAHCQGMTFSTTLLSTLKAQYKIGVVEGVANLGSKTSRFTAVVHEHALHFLNNGNQLLQAPTISSDNHVRIDFPQIRCYGNYLNEHEETKGQLNIRTKIDLLQLTITADFLAQLVFVSQVIIHEINEILAKVSGTDQPRFISTKSVKHSDAAVFSDEDDEDQEKGLESAPIVYRVDVTVRGFKIIGQTPSNTVVKFENGDKELPILIKLTNYDKQNSLVLYSKPIINAQLSMKLSLGQFLSTGGFQDAAYFKTKLLLKNSFKVRMTILVISQMKFPKSSLV